MAWTRRQSDGGPFPWYRSHSRGAILIAIALFAAVTAAHFLTDASGEAVDILFSLPIALLAMAFGLRGGLVGAAVGFSLFSAMQLMDSQGDIDVTGWIARAAGMLLLGVLLGRATDQIKEGQRRALDEHEKRRLLRETAHRQAEALEISDSILQNLAAAKWLVEQGRAEDAIEILTSTLATGQQMVADQLPVRQGGFDALLLEESRPNQP